MHAEGGAGSSADTDGRPGTECPPSSPRHGIGSTDLVLDPTRRHNGVSFLNRSGAVAPERQGGIGAFSFTWPVFGADRLRACGCPRCTRRTTSHARQTTHFGINHHARNSASHTRGWDSFSALLLLLFFFCFPSCFCGRFFFSS